MKFLNKLKAFTLAEVIITLVVIGIIAAVVIPVAIQSKPDENIMKFKKANNTLYQTIKTLINSDKFYCNGDLGMMADCVSLINGYDNEGQYLPDENTEVQYFCRTMADTMSTKKVDCADRARRNRSGFSEPIFLSSDRSGSAYLRPPVVKPVTPESISLKKTEFDDACKAAAKYTRAEIITNDNVVFYQLNCLVEFGRREFSPQVRIFSDPNNHETPVYSDENGFDMAYKGFCIDVDGIPDNGSDDCDDEKDICPFGYGIRADGHIVTGARADEWLKKDFHGEE
ncbi:MAG: type II secretion system protein [Candidatus Gastranaerophilales bacterium]|nr:type II secretion system protein [Candidatus Gastranaerophilales bacterium]